MQNELISYMEGYIDYLQEDKYQRTIQYFEIIARRRGILNKEETYNELTKIAKYLHDEIIKCNFSPSGERWLMINTPAVNILTKVFDMVCDLGIKLEEDFKNEISE